jgi:hypothetical protein
MKLTQLIKIIVLCLLCCVPSFLGAQAISSVTGVVTDSSGAVIVGAQVELANPATGFSVKTTTNGVGAYQFLRVPPGGGYKLTFSKQSFGALVVSDVSLGVSATETQDARLSVGGAAERVEVNAVGNSVNTTDASIGNVITGRQLEDLPSLFRDDASALLQLQPGVQAPESGSDAQTGSVTGSRADAGNVTLDGLDVNDESIGQAFITVGRAPIDSIAEARTIVGNSDATFGRSGGAQVDLVTKSGTNQWHGSASEFNRVSRLAANDFFNNLNGIKKAQLVRNQFGGSLGGPVIKDKLFLFFNYSGRRDAEGVSENLTVPLNAFRNGQISYVNSNAGCTASSTLQSQPSCITTLTPAQAAALDPQGVGPNASLLTFLNSRYPVANNTGAGDGINTGGFAFSAPLRLSENTFVGRLDYSVSSKHQLFARGTWDRDNDTQVVKLFPQDPNNLIGRFVHDRTWVVGHTWAINPAMTNQAFFGLSRQVDDFPSNFAPSAPNLYGIDGLSGPFGDFRGQGRNVAVPEIRDNFSWSRGRHSLQFGADIKPIRVKTSNTNDISFPTIGLNSQITNLDSSLRPADILVDPNNPTAVESSWDHSFTVLLGRFSGNTGQYNYDKAGNPFPQNSPALRTFHYNEYEFFVQDSWKIRSDLTMTYGMRWNYHSVPFEANGFQAVPTVFEQQLFAARQKAAASGTNGFTAAPFVSYVLGGPANHGPSYYHPDWKDFSPRVGIAYSPSHTSGILGRILGDRKTSIRAGGGISYDRVLSTLSFEVDEVSQLFAKSLTESFGVPNNPRASLLQDPRFTSISAPAAPPPPGTAPRPSDTPFTTISDGSNCPLRIFVPAGAPCATGLATNSTLFQLNNNIKTPYSITASFGIQREFPKNFFLDVNYFGRFAHRLIAVGDPAQQLNFKDSQSGQFLNTAFGNVQSALQAGTAPAAIPVQPWFENQMNAALAQSFGAGATCQAVFGAPSCTEFAAANLSQPFLVGDVSTVDSQLANAGFLLPNTGLAYQTGSVANVGNFGASSYNALIVTLRKRFSNHLQFDFNYTYAHSLDNVSDVTNDLISSSFNGQGLVCDLRNLRVCRASSSFDATHTVSANYLLELPIGRGSALLGQAPKWLDAIVGGWETSGIVSYHSGYPWSTTVNSFPIAFTQVAPAVLVGPRSAVKQHIHVQNGALQFFADPTAALNAFAPPFGGATGQRNILRGPGYINVDMALLKNFKMPWSEHQRLQFRAEAFNTFNHPSFNDPSTDPSSIGSLNTANNSFSNPSQYGVLTNTAHSPRQLQLALQYVF